MASSAASNISWTDWFAFALASTKAQPHFSASARPSSGVMTRSSARSHCVRAARVGPAAVGQAQRPRRTLLPTSTIGTESVPVLFSSFSRMTFTISKLVRLATLYTST